MGGAAPGAENISGEDQSALPGSRPDFDSSDPLAALMAQFSQQGQLGTSTTDPLGKNSAQPTKPPTLLQKLLPVLHLLCVWVLLAYFVIWREPEAFGARLAPFGGRSSLARRWGELGRRVGRDGWGVEAVVCS